ncbi:MAG: hypothetical protein MUC34_20905 [Anaerolineae bacterium]|nr:hypothetical protein [Anaerolineae bacterium]
MNEDDQPAAGLRKGRFKRRTFEGERLATDSEGHIYGERVFVRGQVIAPNAVKDRQQAFPLRG